jgi:2-methylcitrate dehydratase PrpD
MAAERIVGFLDAARSEAPGEVRHEAQRVLLSGLRAALAASRESMVASVVRSERDRLGRPASGSTVLWRGSSLPAEEAAGCNAMAWSLLLLDDIEVGSGIHPGGASAVSALALGEQRGVSGPNLLAAIAAGVEVQMVVASALVPELLRDRGFAPLSVVAPLGATSAALALGGIDPATAQHAVGMASMSGIGMWEMGGTGSAVALVGAAVRLGLSAVRFAEASVDAPPCAFEGEAGAFRAYCGKDPAVLFAGLSTLGAPWRIGNLWYTPYSGDTYSQAPLEAVAELRRRANAEGVPGSVVGITVGVHERVKVGIERKHARYPTVTTPLQFNSDPQLRVAAAWLRGIFSYGPEFLSMLADPEVVSLRERVRVAVEPSHQDMRSATVEIEFSGGARWLAAVPGFTGSAGRRLSDDDLSDWFIRTAGPLLEPARIDRVLEAVWGLDRAGSIDALVQSVADVPDINAQL